MVDCVAIAPELPFRSQVSLIASKALDMGRGI